MRSRHGADRWLMPCQCPRFFCPGSSRTGRLTSLRRSQLRSCRHTASSPGGIGLPKAPPSLRHIDLDQAVDDVLAPAGPRPVVHRLLDVRRRPPRGGDRILRAYRRRNQLIVFNNVDVNTQIEGEVAGQRSSSYSRSGGGRQERRRDLRRDPAGTQLRSVHGAPLPRHDRRSQHASPGAVPRLAGGDVEPVLVQALRWHHRPELHRHVRPRRRLGASRSHRQR